MPGVDPDQPDHLAMDDPTAQALEWQRDVSDHGEVELPGPPRARQVLGALVLLLGGLVLFGAVPFGATTFGVALLLVAAGLIV